MECLFAKSLKFKQGLIFVIILSIMNSSISLGMDIDLDERKSSHFGHTPPILENDEEIELSIMHSSISPGMDTDLDERKLSHFGHTPPILENSEEIELGIMNSSISPGMDTDLEKGKTLPENEERLLLPSTYPSVSSRVLASENELKSQEITDESLNLANLSGPISSNYVLAFQNAGEEKESKFLIIKRITGLLVGTIICIPLIDLTIAEGEYYGSKELGYGLVILKFFAQGGIGAWITSEFMEDAYALAKKVKKQTASFWSIDTLKELKFGLLAFLLATLSSSSDVYKIYLYNNTKELAIITFIWDVVTRTLGMYKALNTLSLKLTNFLSKEDCIIREKGIGYINVSRRNFLHISKKDGINTLSLALKDCETPDMVYSCLTSGLEQSFSEAEASFSIVTRDYEKGYVRKIAIALALIFPTSTATFNLVMAYKGYELLFDNSVSSGILTGISIVPTSALGYYVVTTAVSTIFYNFYLYRNGLEDAGYFNTFHPTLNKTFLGTSFLLGSITALAGFGIIVNNMGDTIFDSFKYVVASLSVVSGIIFETYTIFSTIKGYGEEVVKRCNKGASYIFGCLKKLDDLSNSICASSIDIVSDFIGEIYPLDFTEDY